ncbi:hypothetical protein M3Y98_00146300 [Aphelenchoides besseyi]|nr:hypothetical protein M3Y98_00146300 [Aphelenchoides besseyi]KAI6199760.1 hypothetical protein M3Y96_00661000 [Aphelenchoides besseyi]
MVRGLAFSLSFCLLVSSSLGLSFAYPYGSYFPYYRNDFDNDYGLSGSRAHGWSHLGDLNHGYSTGYEKGDRADWSNLEYGGHKSTATGHSYENSHENDKGDDFGHRSGYENGFDHGHDSLNHHNQPVYPTRYDHW